MIRRNPDGCFTAALYRALRNLDYWGSLGCFRIHKPCPDRVLDTVHPLRTGGTSLQFRGVKQMEETTEIQKAEHLPAEKPAEKPKKKKLSKKKIALIVAAALILVPLGSCVYGTLTYKPTLNGAAASMGEIRTTVSFSANVAGDGLEKYPIPETTEVEKVYFEVGDSVKAGDLIVKFDNSEAVDAYKKATINYETARLQLNETEKDYWDLKEDLDDCIEDIEFYKEKWKDYEDYETIGNTTDEDLIEANRLYNNYFSKWEAAKDQKEALEKQIPSADYIKIQQLNFELTKMTLDEAEDVYNNLPQDIYAQHDGVIETIGVTDYGTAAKGTVAVSILTSESNTVEFNIGRYDIGDIQVGQKATATIGGVEYPGTVTHIDSVAKDDSVRAEVTLDNPEGVVPGISAELDIETYLNENCLTIPIEASKTDRTGDYCYVARDNGDGTYRPEKVYITTGNSSLTSVEVLEGLNEGDIVITNPPANIENMTSASLILA